MKRPKSYSPHPKHLQNARAFQREQVRESTQQPAAAAPPQASRFRTTARDETNPVDYQHPYESMARFAQALALCYDANRTRHAYYRQVRLIPLRRIRSKTPFNVGHPHSGRVAASTRARGGSA